MKTNWAAGAAAAGLALAALTACTAGGGPATVSTSTEAPPATTSGAATEAGTVLPTPPSDWSQSPSATAFAALGADPFAGTEPAPTLRVRLQGGLTKSSKSITIKNGDALYFTIACASPGGFDLKVLRGKEQVFQSGQKDCTPDENGVEVNSISSDFTAALPPSARHTLTVKFARGSADGEVEFGLAIGPAAKQG